jgi:dTDP-D-glucose 4,6-dehydratase
MVAMKLPGWEPQVPFREGLRRTVDWYCSTKNRAQVGQGLGHVLTER